MGIIETTIDKKTLKDLVVETVIAKEDVYPTLTAAIIDQVITFLKNPSTHKGYADIAKQIGLAKIHTNQIIEIEKAVQEKIVKLTPAPEKK